MDVRTAEQMQEIAHVFHQIINFDPLVYDVENQDFVYWYSLDSAIP